MLHQSLPPRLPGLAPVFAPVFAPLFVLILANPSVTLAAAPATAMADSQTQAAAPLALKYCSVFTHYQRFQEQPVVSWQKTNAAVHQAGGWRALAKEARQAGPADPKPVDPDCPPGIAPAMATPDTPHSAHPAGAKP